jgi:hypothetical protein
MEEDMTQQDGIARLREKDERESSLLFETFKDYTSSQGDAKVIRLVRLSNTIIHVPANRILEDEYGENLVEVSGVIIELSKPLRLFSSYSPAFIYTKSYIDLGIAEGTIVETLEPNKVFQYKHITECVELVGGGFVCRVASGLGYVMVEQNNETLYYKNLDEALQDFDYLVFIHDQCYYVTESYAQNNYYFHERTEEWNSYPEAEEEYYQDDDELDEYGFNPARKWGFESAKHGKTTKAVQGELYYGIELEYELDSSPSIEAIKETAHDLEFGACHDGSLNRGVEFKSKPLTVSLLKKRVKALLNIVKSDVVAESTCGIHIHLSRSGLTLFQVGLMQEFIYNQHNFEFLDKLSGRSPNKYCQRNGGYKLTSRLEAVSEPLIKSRKKDYLWSGRYEAINFESRDTIEFRMFASSKQEVRVVGRIEFVEALVSWCSSSSRLSRVDTINHEKFLEFVKKSGAKKYPMLLELMYDKGILVKKISNKTKLAV